MDAMNWDKQQTGKAIADYLGVRSNAHAPERPVPPPPEEPVSEWVPIIPPPPDANPFNSEVYVPSKEHTKKYNFHHLWEWHGVGYVGRFHLPDGKKIVWQICWTGDRWTQVAIKKNKPLFGLETLTNKKSAVVVEGEKTQVAAKQLLPGFTVVCAQGGSGMVKATDWSPLVNKKVFVFPDNDEVGNKYAIQVQAALKGYAEVIIVEPPEGKKEGWDLADALVEGWTKESTLEYIRTHQRPQPQTQSSSMSQAQSESQAPKSIIDIIRPLGHSNGVYFYCPLHVKEVVELSAHAHTSRGLMQLAPIYQWSQAFPKPTGTPVDWDFASDFCMTACHRQGIFNPTKIRGRGVWEDEGRTVLNTGEKLRCNGVEVDHNTFESKFIYQFLPSKDWYNLSNVLSDSDLAHIVEATDSINWTDPVSAILLQGKIVTDPICAALAWRPHGWLIGSTGTGKTTIMRDLLGALYGDWCLRVKGETTEAGIRQRLASSAIPVLFDESEANEEGDERRIQKILGLARQSSADDDATTLKGTQNQKGASFESKAAYTFSSINSSLKQKADETRVFLLEINSQVPADIKRDSYERFLKATGYFDSAFSPRFLTRVVLELPTILDRVKRGKKILLDNQFPARLADQYATALAGASILYPGINFDSWFRDLIPAISPNKAIMESETQEEAMLDDIFNTIVFMPGKHGGGKSVPLRSALTICMEPSGFEDGFFDRDEVELQLLAYGIKPMAGAGIVYISNKNKNLAGILKHSNWVPVLSRLKGAIRTAGSIRFGASASRAVSIPWDSIKVKDS